jgi:predicted permease
MARLPIRKMVGNLSVYLTTILRLLVIPISIHLLFTAIGFQPLSVAINTVIIAMPVATYGTIFCLKEGIDVTVMTEVTFISTIVSIATVPMITLLFI